MDFSNTVFRRKFAMTMYKDQRLTIGKMTFAKDFVNDRRGDLYPVIEKSGDCIEAVENNRYVVSCGSVKRMVCQFFPYATYEITVEKMSGKAGFCFSLPGSEACVAVENRSLTFSCGQNAEKTELPSDLGGQWTMIVTARPGAFDVYFKNNGRAQFCHTFPAEAFCDSNRHSLFSGGCAAVCIAGEAVAAEVRAYLDNGISQADLRPIRYENGEIMLEQGKVYLTASVRQQEKGFQGIFSWVPGTAEIELTGAVFYDAGDGRWCGDVAASVLYHREQKQFYLWVCSFSHGHILGHSVFEGDLRFGVNVVDIRPMEKAPENADICAFLGFEGDEDPDFFYDEENCRWLMAICRVDPAIRRYRYMFFESREPFAGYTCIGKGLDGAETGGSFVKIKGEQYFVCGNDFHAVSDYRIYGKDGMQKAVFDRPDGGFRGWGTLMPVKLGSRVRYFWITFDRHNGSAYNWSYGNLYCFEAEL